METVTIEEVGKLTDQVSSLVYWLRQLEPRNAGDLILVGAGEPTPREVHHGLRQLVQATEYNNQVLNVNQLRFILSSYDAKVWAKCLFKVVTEAVPRLVDSRLAAEMVELTAGYLEHGKNEPVETLIKELITPMDNLTRTSFNGLGELCSMLRDCCGDSAKIAGEVGPRMFMVPHPTQASYAASKYLMQLLVSRSEDIFGQSGSSKKTLDSFGIRKKNRLQTESANWDLDGLMPASYKHKKNLKTFYRAVDPKYIPVADSMFKYHSLQDVAYGLYHKYKMIPLPFKAELQRLKSSGERLDWFNVDTIQVPKPGRRGTLVTVQRDPPVIKGRTEMDALVDSFIDSEVQYYRQMRALGQLYVYQLNEISNGRSRGRQEAAVSLGLNTLQCDMLFGIPWQQVMDFSHQLLVRLEVISLVRTQPLERFTREGILSEILGALTPGKMYFAYVNYFAGQRANVELLQDRVANLSRVPSMGGYPNFAQLWEQVSSQSTSLNGMQLFDVLTLPMKRIAAIKFMMDSMYNLAQKSGSPGLGKVQVIYQKYSALNDGLQQAYARGRES